MSHATRMLFCTCADNDEAGRLAHLLVEQRVAACVNIVPHVRSVYEWQGKIEDDSEVLLIIKTSKLKLEALKEAIQTHHSYESPELISFEIDDGLPAYLDWVEAQTK
ncbi:divalent-cation tolerance protein CutA [Idiomarina sp. OT37-5b]|uniref:Divalent-cation tolerance protein CutA n=2 Tax=Idiomarinaceae TaxID=267893 RepID=A0AA94ECV8_9GAMM|nr:divalent-cation tolerance protein CutA [Idiomarina sp. OT37-5b]RUO40171.1 divalent-cation tolerance protein CutA [Idiomarina aquatica]